MPRAKKNRRSSIRLTMEPYYRCFNFINAHVPDSQTIFFLSVSFFQKVWVPPVMPPLYVPFKKANRMETVPVILLLVVAQFESSCSGIINTAPGYLKRESERTESILPPPWYIHRKKYQLHRTISFTCQVHNNRRCFVRCSSTTKKPGSAVVAHRVPEKKPFGRS